MSQPLSRLRALAALLVVCLGTLSAPLDSAVNIAFPAITEAFGLPAADIRWVIIAYVLTYASLTLIFGKVGDLFGYRRVFRTGLVIAAAGFLVCSAATRFELLLAGRILQGIGIALTWSCAPALATSLYPESQRTRVLGFYSGAIACGTALGPLAGGMLVQTFGWPVVFWARLPLVAAALALAWIIPAPPAMPNTRSFDWTGALLLVAWLVTLLLAAAQPAVPHPELVTMTLIIIGAAAFALFLRHETTHPDPIIRPQLFRDAGFLGLNVASVAVNLAGFAVMLLVPFHLARTAGLSASVGGLVLGSNAVGIVLGSWAAGRIAERVGHTRLMFAGGLVSAAGLALVSSWERDTAPLAMAACLGAQGFGLGLFQVAYGDRVLATLPRADRGVAGSLTLVTRTLGVVGAAAGLATLSRRIELAAIETGHADAALAAFQTTFRTVSIGLGSGLALALVLVLANKRNS